MPLSAINVARFIALENKLSKLWHLINIKCKEETTDFKNVCEDYSVSNKEYVLEAILVIGLAVVLNTFDTGWSLLKIQIHQQSCFLKLLYELVTI